MPDDMAGRAGGLLIRLGLAVLMIALPLAAIYSRRLVFTLMPVGAALIFFGSAMTPGNTIAGDVRRGLASPAGFAAIAFLFWAGMSILWTPYPKPAAEQLAKSAGTIMLAFVVIAALPTRSRTSNLNLMPIGAGVAAVVAAGIALFAPMQTLMPALQPINMPDLEFSTIERASIGLVLLVWPALAALGMRERWASGGALAVAVTIAAVAVWTPAALAGMAAGALVFSIAISKPSRTGAVLGMIFALLILAAPALPLAAEYVLRAMPSVPLAVSKGIGAWAELAREAPERLITGHGFQTLQRALAAGYLPQPAQTNLLAELWFELGALGALAAAATAACGFIAAGRTNAHGAPFLLAGMTCVMVIAIWGLATFNLWWITLLGAMAISFGCVLKGQIREGRPDAGAIRIAAARAGEG